MVFIIPPVIPGVIDPECQGSALLSMFAVLSSARKGLTKVVLGLSVFALAACDGFELPAVGGGNTGAGPRIDTSKPVPVALLLPKSEAGAASVARSLENAARLAVADLGDVKIDLRVYDTAGNPAQAGAQAQKAVDDGAKIILGPLFAGAAVEASKAVADEGVNVLAFSNNTSIAGGNLFVLGPTFENTARRLVGFAARQGKKSAVIVHPTNVEGQFGRNAIQAAAAASGLQIAAIAEFEFSQAGVVGAIPRIRDAVKNNNADAVFMTSNSAGALPLLAQLLPEAGVSNATAQYVGLSRWDVPAQTLDLPGLQGGWFAIPDQQTDASFRSRYNTAYSSAPHQLAGLGFDGIAAIGALVKAGKSNALTGAALTQSAGFQGVGGVFRLRADGTNERALAVATIREKKVVILDPAPKAFGGAGF